MVAFRAPSVTSTVSDVGFPINPGLTDSDLAGQGMENFLDLPGSFKRNHRLRYFTSRHSDGAAQWDTLRGAAHEEHRVKIGPADAGVGGRQPYGRPAALPFLLQKAVPVQRFPVRMEVFLDSPSLCQ